MFFFINICFVSQQTTWKTIDSKNLLFGQLIFFNIGTQNMLIQSECICIRPLFFVSINKWMPFAWESFLVSYDQQILKKQSAFEHTHNIVCYFHNKNPIRLPTAMQLCFDDAHGHLNFKLKVPNNNNNYKHEYRKQPSVCLLTILADNSIKKINIVYDYRAEKKFHKLNSIRSY